MHMTQIQSVLNEKKITFSYTEEDNCGSIDFEHRGLRYHIWEFADDVEPVGVETNLRYAGRDEEIEGDYDTILAEHLKNFKRFHFIFGKRCVFYDASSSTTARKSHAGTV